MSARSRRWWLVLLAVVSLVLLVFAGVTAAFSVPVTDDIQAANRLPGADAPATGTRALVLPPADVTQIATFEKPRNVTSLGYNGSILVAGDGGALFPAQASRVTMGRALAYVTPTADGSYVPATIELAGLPTSDGNSTRFINVTVNVSALAEGHSGFLVKGDAESNVTFVIRDRVLGSVERFDPSSALVLTVTMGAFGFLAPVVALIVTHKPRGKPGIGGATLCPECRNPVAIGADFCTRCGSWLKDGAKK